MKGEREAAGETKQDPGEADARGENGGKTHGENGDGSLVTPTTIRGEANGQNGAAEEEGATSPAVTLGEATS